MKNFSTAAILALKEALTFIYWKKKDLRSFIYYTINNKLLVSTIDWENNTKNEIASQIIDRMLVREDIYKDDLLRLFDSVIHFSDFSHLKYWEDSETKIKRAEESVKALRAYSSDYFTLKEEKERAEERKKAYIEFVSENINFQQKVTELGSEFYTISVETNPQKRGYLFEKFLNSLFSLFELDPKESFKITGEQIDGAFTFDNQDYLLEAKWRSEPIQAGDLFDFGGKISGKFKSALGLFISINGFSTESTLVNSPIIKSMILMDGLDLIAVLENRISLSDMLYRKRRHAVEKGEIFLRYKNF